MGRRAILRRFRYAVGTLGYAPWHTSRLAQIIRAPMQFSPSADRNKQPIVDVLKDFAPFSIHEKPAKVLEVASGTGQHVAFYATNFSHCEFQPTEYSGGSSGPEASAYEDLAPVFA